MSETYNPLELINAKIALYSQLLKKDADLWTDNEASLGYVLCIDDDIQRIFERGMKLEKERDEIKKS